MPTPAPTPSPVVTLPFDPTGAAPSNLVQGERQPLAAVPYQAYSVQIPNAAPYFQPSLQLTLLPSNTPLVEGIDYACTHKFMEATRSIGIPVYGSVTFYNNMLQGVISYNYQSLGGQWTLTPSQINTILANIIANPRITTWEQITDLPDTFPPINHVWNIDDMVNMDSVVTAIEAITAAVTTQQTSVLTNHINNFNNPHEVTAAQVNLGNVPNVGYATLAEAQGGTGVNMMSGYLVGQAITAQVGTAFNNHINDHNNPHGVNAAQVGLGNVPNWVPATIAMAQAGTDTASFMTPALVQAAIVASGAAGLAQHIADHNNPHAVTSAQVGLGNVPNVGYASTADAQSGTGVNLMNPTLTAQAISAQVGTTLTNHINNTNNPHNTTAAQVNAYSIAQVNSLLGGYQPALGFTPVQQGGGANQGTNHVYIGWSTDGSGLRCTVDATYLGRFLFDTSSISISQVANLQNTLNGLLSTSGTAANSNALSGQGIGYFGTAGQISSLQSQIDSLQSQINALKSTPTPTPSPTPSPSPSPTPTPAPVPAPVGGGGGGGCVATTMYLQPSLLAADVEVGQYIDGVAYSPDRVMARRVDNVQFMLQPCLRMTTVSGIEVIASTTTPMTMPDGSLRMFPDMLGQLVLVDDNGDVRWEMVKDLVPVGLQMVALISMDNQNYFAGTDPLRRIGTHNLIAQK